MRQSIRDEGWGRVAGAFAVGLAALPVSYVVGTIVFPEGSQEGFAEILRYVIIMPIGSAVGGFLAAVTAGRGRGIVGWLAMLGGMLAVIIGALVVYDQGDFLGPAMGLYGVPASIGFLIGAAFARGDYSSGPGGMAT